MHSGRVAAMGPKCSRVRSGVSSVMRVMTDLLWPGRTTDPGRAKRPVGSGGGCFGASLRSRACTRMRFDPAPVDEVHVQGPAADVVQTLRRVALSQADQLVSLPHLGPWKGTVKEPVGEFGHRRSLFGRAALDALGGSQGCRRSARLDSRRHRWSGRREAGGDGA